MFTLAYTLWGSVAEPRRARGFPFVFNAGPTAMHSIAWEDIISWLIVGDGA
jgi:hypothetical protein